LTTDIQWKTTKMMVGSHVLIIIVAYPDQVLFIEAPTDEVLNETASKRGPLWEELSKDRVLLQIRHGVQHVREVTHNAIESWVPVPEEEADDQDLYTLVEDTVIHSGEAQVYANKSTLFISKDGIHPNENG
jgi:hypothetical protein